VIHSIRSVRKCVEKRISSLFEPLQQWRGVQCLSPSVRQRLSFREYCRRAKNWFDQRKLIVYQSDVFSELLHSVHRALCQSVGDDRCGRFRIALLKTVHSIFSEKVIFPSTRPMALIPAGCIRLRGSLMNPVQLFLYFKVDRCFNLKFWENADQKYAKQRAGILTKTQHQLAALIRAELQNATQSPPSSESWKSALVPPEPPVPAPKLPPQLPLPSFPVLPPLPLPMTQSNSKTTSPSTGGLTLSPSTPSSSTSSMLNDPVLSLKQIAASIQNQDVNQPNEPILRSSDCNPVVNLQPVQINQSSINSNQRIPAVVDLNQLRLTPIFNGNMTAVLAYIESPRQQPVAITSILGQLPTPNNVQYQVQYGPVHRATISALQNGRWSPL